MKNVLQYLYPAEGAPSPANRAEEKDVWSSVAAGRDRVTYVLAKGTLSSLEQENGFGTRTSTANTASTENMSDQTVSDQDLEVMRARAQAILAQGIDQEAVGSVQTDTQKVVSLDAYRVSKAEAETAVTEKPLDINQIRHDLSNVYEDAA
jgi:hypothetical protein